MVSRERIKNQAVMMGIETGDMPEVNYIWEVERDEWHETCFGQGLGGVRTACHWRISFLTLSYYIEKGARAEKVNRNRRVPERFNQRTTTLLHPSLTENSLGKI